MFPTSMLILLSLWERNVALTQILFLFSSFPIPVLAETIFLKNLWHMHFVLINSALTPFSLPDLICWLFAKDDFF